METNKKKYVTSKERVKLSSGDVVRIACEMLEMTQAKLAKKSGIAESHISLIINGKRKIGRAVAEKLAKALNIPPEHILFAKHSPRKQSHVAAIDKKVEELKEQKEQRSDMISETLNMFKGLRVEKRISPKLKTIEKTLKLLKEENEEEDITGLYAITKKALEKHNHS